MNIGDRIKERRSKLDLTLEDIAKLVGVSRQTIQKYESGVISNIPSDKIELIAGALSTTPSFLMGWDDEAIEIKYSSLSSCNSENLNRYADYLYLRERQLIADNNSFKYMDFIIAEKTNKLNNTGKKEALKRIDELAEIPRYSNNE